MLTPEQRVRLNAFANGTAQCDVPQTPQVIEVRQQAAGCAESCNVGATPETVLIDAAKANVAQCGMFTIAIDRSGTTDIAADVQLTIGGCITTQALAEEFYNFPALALFSDRDIANQVGATEPNYAGSVFLPFLDCLVEGRNVVVKGITATNTGGATAQAAFDIFKRNRILASTLDIENNWGVCEANRSAIKCQVCNDDDTVAGWTGFMGLTSRSAISIRIPTDLVADLEICVYQIEGARNLTMCGA